MDFRMFLVGEKGDRKNVWVTAMTEQASKGLAASMGRDLSRNGELRAMTMLGGRLGKKSGGLMSASSNGLTVWLSEIDSGKGGGLAKKLRGEARRLTGSCSRDGVFTFHCEKGAEAGTALALFEAGLIGGETAGGAGSGRKARL